jgi:ribonuclease HI
MDENTLEIYTDGSSLSNPRTGGIGIRYLYIGSDGNEKIEDLDNLLGFKNATNNQMELQACVVALEKAKKIKEFNRINKIVIYSDSKYVVDNYPLALFHWQKTKWITSAGNPVLNANIWKDLIKEVRKVGKPVRFIWVKGHSKDFLCNIGGKIYLL